MYMARNIINGKVQYTLRRSIKSSHGFTSQDIFELGDDPSKFIVYPGGNAYYIVEEVEDALATSGVALDGDQLESVFWPFIRKDIQQAVETFRHRSPGKIFPLSDDDKRFIQHTMPVFDKRRHHFLKFGEIDQGTMENMPVGLFKSLVNKSRDEIEQIFMQQESWLKASELKTYLFAALDLQRFFQSFMAKSMPQALDQEKIDEYFIKELCHINASLFATPDMPAPGMLNPNLHRYVIMFFDYDYAHSTLLDDFSKRFMNRHRQFHPPAPKTRVSLDKALSDMSLDSQTFSTMSSGALSRHYRKLARKHHPDKGGDAKQFVSLNQAYESLMERINEPVD